MDIGIDYSAVRRICSNDAHFKRQNAARVITTKDILPLLGI